MKHKNNPVRCFKVGISKNTECPHRVDDWLRPTCTLQDIKCEEGAFPKKCPLEKVDYLTPLIRLSDETEQEPKTKITTEHKPTTSTFVEPIKASIKMCTDNVCNSCGLSSRMNAGCRHPCF